MTFKSNRYPTLRVNDNRIINNRIIDSIENHPLVTNRGIFDRKLYLVLDRKVLGPCLCRVLIFIEERGRNFLSDFLQRCNEYGNRYQSFTVKLFCISFDNTTLN